MRVRDFSHGVRRAVKCNAPLFRLCCGVFPRYRRLFVAPTSDLLIEGFPRSANSFCVWAFRLANPGLRLSSHMHAAAHVLWAVRYRVPALVLLREPESAVLSLLVMRPHLDPRQLLLDYTSFYQSLEAYRGDIVLAKFETVIDNFDSVVAAVNARFGTAFNPLGTPDDVERVIEIINEDNRKRYGGEISPRIVPRPHPDREAIKRELGSRFEERDWLPARLAYEKLVSNAV